MSYYDDYGAAQEWSEAMRDLESAISQQGALWSNYYGQKANRQLQWDMLKYQLDWNSPINQTFRLRAAGLNPYDGHAIQVGNMDSLPDMGPDPLQGVAEGLTRNAQMAIQRLSSHTAVQEARLRAKQVDMELQRLAMSENLFPIQRRIAENNALTSQLTNEFLNSSMQDRLEALILSNKHQSIENSIRSWFSLWMGADGKGYDYYDELFRSLKVKNDYTDWLKSFNQDRWDTEKEHWDIINNPFGLNVGSGTINGFLNLIFQFLRLFSN